MFRAKPNNGNIGRIRNKFACERSIQRDSAAAISFFCIVRLLSRSGGKMPKKKRFTETNGKDFHGTERSRRLTLPTSCGREVATRRKIGLDKKQEGIERRDESLGGGAVPASTMRSFSRRGRKNIVNLCR